STTKTGVPNSSAISGSGTPATVTTPSSWRAALRGHTWAGRSLKSEVMRLHPLRGGDTDQAERVGQGLAGGGGQRQAGGVDRGRLFVGLRQDLAVVVEAVEHAGQFLGVTGDAVRLTQFRGGLDHVRELAEGADEVALP